MAKLKEHKNSISEELGYLIKLIDDESDFVYSNVKEKLISYGSESVNFLNNNADFSNPLISQRVNEIFSMINFKSIQEKFEELKSKNNNELLEEAIFLIASYGYPDISIDNYKMIIDKMALDIEREIYEQGFMNNSAIDIINLINGYLFDDKGFSGNSDDYYDPDNSYINKVIDRKTGIPVSISILYILIAKRINIPIFGVNLPSHFIIKYQDSKEEFFIDPFNKGIVISKDEVLQFLDKLGMDEDEFNHIPYLKIAEDREIIFRVLANLINIYTKEGNDLKVTQLRVLQTYFE